MKNTHVIKCKNTAQTRHITRNKQAGFSTMDFIFWLVFAAIGLAGLMQLYTSATASSNRSSVATDLVQIKAAVDEWKGQRTNLTGVSMTSLCATGYGNTGTTWCGANADGKNANVYGGDYTVTVSSNVSLVDISVAGINQEYISALGNKLAPISADRCHSIDSCSTVTASGSIVKVTM